MKDHNSHKFHTPYRPHLSFVIYHLLFIISFCFCSCTSDEEYDPYADWQARNDAWFADIYSQARGSIDAAQQQDATNWEALTDWRIYNSLMKSNTGQSTDCICVRVLKHGNGTASPISTDTAYVAFQGYLIPTTDVLGNRIEKMFASTYQGTFDPATAIFSASKVSAYQDGFYTALQYMVGGDSWEVFIPYQLFYGETAQNTIPAYSAARFLIHMKE